MARKYKTEKTRSSFFSTLKEETLQGVWAVLFFALALFFTLAFFNIGGSVGYFVRELFYAYLFGVGYFLLPIAFIMLGISLFRTLEQHFAVTKIIGSGIFLLSGLGLIDLMAAGRAGKVGMLVSHPMVKLFDFWASLAFLFAFLLISFLIIFDTKLSFGISFIWNKLFGKKDDEDDKKKADEYEEIEEVKIEKKDDKKENIVPENPLKKIAVGKPGGTENGFDISQPKSFTGVPYVPPPLSLLEYDKGKPGVGDIKANANIIKRTLQNFGINVEMDEISIGPSVTRYALKPAEGVKLSRIVGLQNDLALALAAHPIRIEAPIPGKSLVGIEIPNSTKTTVGLATLLSADEYQNSEKPLLVALGKGISGKCHFGNLAKMPHLLIAGATGSGKSVTIHAIITSLLYRNSPENMKFMMIDPKRVELTLYNKIPHLLTPVITEAKKTILALKWAAKEMDRRYDVLEAESVRDIESYHKNILAPAMKKQSGKKNDGTVENMPETMPYIVIVIDELADIMQSYPRELESAIVRLAQMSRAVGIHLILSTQRPSVNVITGLIKANIPSRVALQVASQVDSRTILDMAGAEKLLGAGDMLYMSGEMSKPARIQSSFISETELKNVVKYLSDSYKNEVPNEINLTATESGGRNSIFDAAIDDVANDPGEEDDLYEEARSIVISAGKASTSYLQRRLKVGYSRAARLIDMLEEHGVVGPGSGSKPREVLEKGATEEAKEFGDESEADEDMPEKPAVTASPESEPDERWIKDNE